MMIKVVIYLIWEELYFWLVYWYKTKPKKIIQAFFNFLLDLDQILNFRAHLRNFSVPLYGQKDLISFLISVVYRIIILFITLILILISGFLWLFILLFWLSLPIYPILIIIFGKNGILF